MLVLHGDVRIHSSKVFSTHLQRWNLRVSRQLGIVEGAATGNLGTQLTRDPILTLLQGAHLFEFQVLCIHL